MALNLKPVLDVSVEAASDLSNYQFMFIKLDSNGRATPLAAAGDIPYGILQNTPGGLGQEATVRIMGASQVVANAALAINTFVKADYATGKAADAVADKDLIQGVVMDNSGADLDLATILLLPKTGQAGPKVKKTVISAINTAGAAVYTAAQLLGGYINRDCNGGNRSDVLPNATSIIAAMVNPQVGDSFEVVFSNTSAATYTLTLTVPTGGGITLSTDSTNTVAKAYARRYLAVVTNVGTPAITFYSEGTYAK